MAIFALRRLAARAATNRPRRGAWRMSGALAAVACNVFSLPAAAQSPASSEVQEIPQPLELASLRPGRPEALAPLVVEALRAYPALRRARRSTAAARELPSQLGALPDPVFSVALQNIRTDDVALDGSPMSGIQVGLSQTFPFPGRLARRHAVGVAMVTTTDKLLAQSEAEAVLRVKRAYWRLQLAEATERVVRTSENLINTLAGAVIARFAVGQGAQQDSLQAEVAHSRLRALLEEQRQEVRSARRALNGAVGRQPDDGISTADVPPAGPVSLDRERLLKDAARLNPAIAVKAAQIEVARRSVDEAERSRYPDFQVGAFYRFREAAPGDMSRGADMFGLSFAVPLPVWMESKQSARVRQTSAELDAAREDAADVALEVVTQLQETADAVDRLSTQIELFQQELLPEASQALDASIADYQFARVGFVSVLKNWEMDLDTRLAFARLLSERAMRLAQIEALVGRRP